jgi:hypothetical protein
VSKSKLPPGIEKISSRLAREHEDAIDGAYPQAYEEFKAGFDTAAHLILAEAQKLVNALEDSDCKCDYPTMFCCDRCRALKAWNEFLGG